MQLSSPRSPATRQMPCRDAARRAPAAGRDSRRGCAALSRDAGATRGRRGHESHLPLRAGGDRRPCAQRGGRSAGAVRRARRRGRSRSLPNRRHGSCPRRSGGGRARPGVRRGRLAARGLGLHLRDEGERLTAVKGLLTRRVVHLDRDRLRGADVRDTVLRRPFGLASVTVIAAGIGGRDRGTTLAPVLRMDEVPALVRAVDPQAPRIDAPLAPHPIRRARPRRLVGAVALPLASSSSSPFSGFCGGSSWRSFCSRWRFRSRSTATAARTRVRRPAPVAASGSLHRRGRARSGRGGGLRAQARRASGEPDWSPSAST